MIEVDDLEGSVCELLLDREDPIVGIEATVRPASVARLSLNSMMIVKSGKFIQG